MPATHFGFVVNEADHEWVRAPDPWRREISKTRWKILVPVEGQLSRDLSFGLAEIEPGGRIVLHHHPAAEIYYCISGRGRVVIDGESHEVGPGDTVYIPADAEHRFDNGSDEALRFIFVFPGHSHAEIPYNYLEAGEVDGENA